MAKEVSKQTLNVFEQIKQTDEQGNEFWGARQLARVLNYTDFRNFQSVINKAKEACRNSGQLVEQHLVDFNEVLIAGQGANKKLTRRIMKQVKKFDRLLKKSVELCLKNYRQQIVSRNWKVKRNLQNLRKGMNIRVNSDLSH